MGFARVLCRFYTSFVLGFMQVLHGPVPKFLYGVFIWGLCKTCIKTKEAYIKPRKPI